MAAVPTPTDNPNRTAVGRAELLSNVPTSLTRSLHNILVANLSSIFLDFENITQNILNNECGSFPEDNDSTDFECWRRLSTSVTDVDFLGIDFQAVLFRNQDLSPPGASFVSMFNTSVERMKANATQAMQFINNIPAELKVNLDHCNLSLSQILLPRPTIVPTPSNSTDMTPSHNADRTPSNNADMIPTTTLTELTQSTVGMMSSTPTSTEIPDVGSAKQTGLSTGLLLLPIVVSLFLIFKA